MTVTVNTIPSSTPAEQTEEQKAHLIAVAEGTAKPGDAPKPEGELILGKFKTPEDLAKAYAELEKKLGAPKGEEAKPDDQGKKPDGEGKPDSLKLEEGKKEDEGKTEDDEAKKALEGAGLDFASYNDSFMENGTLSDEQFADLEKKGFNRETVDVYLDGLRARQERAMNSAFELTGGPDNYRAMGQWAGANLPAAERDAFNKAVTSGTAEQRELAIRGLYAKFTAAAGEPELTNGRGSGPTTTGYRSWGEVTEAMKDKRYGKDPAYTRDVQNKMKVSKF